MGLKISHNTGNRFYNIDILRIIAAVLVIGIHNQPLLIKSGMGVNDFIISLLISCNSVGLPLFFSMMSLALTNNHDYISNLKDYYLRKLYFIFIPFIGFGLLYNYVKTDAPWSFISAFRATFTEAQYYHLWFCYVYIGMVLAIPFVKVLLEKLRFRYLTALIIISLILIELKTYGLIRYEYYCFDGWWIYLMIAVWLLRKDSFKYHKCIMIIGLVAYFAIVIIEFRFSDTILCTHLFDLSLFMILFESMVFVSFLHIICSKDHNGKIWIFIRRLSKSTLFIYLIHPFIMKTISNYKLNTMFQNHFLNYFASIIITFCISGVVSIILCYIQELPIHLIKLRKALNI